MLKVKMWRTICTCFVTASLLGNIMFLNTTVYAVEKTNTQMLTAYKEKLHSFENETINGMTSDTEYYIYDIDKNSVPELIVKHGTCEADYYYTVSSFENNAVKDVGELMGGHTALAGYLQNGIICHTAHMGYEMLWLYSLENGNLNKTEIYSAEGDYQYDNDISKFPNASEWLISSKITDYALLEKYIESNSYTGNENYPDYVEAYADFLQKAFTVKDESSNGDNRISALQLVDIDFNSVPELIIFDGGSGGSIGVNIVAVVNGAAKIIYGSSYFSNEAFEKDAAIAYTDENGQIGARFYNVAETLSDVFEMRRMDGTGELFWYLKSTEENGEKILYSAYKCEKNDFMLSNIATSAFEADYDADPEAVWSMFFMHTTHEQGYKTMLSARNEDYTVNSEWETIKNNREKLKQWLSSYSVQDIYDGRQATVIVNDTKIQTDNLTIICDGRTLVPLRTISEALGAAVDWNGETQTVTVQRNGTAVLMSIGQDTFYKNDTPVALDVAPMIKNDRTLVPIRAIAEAFDCEVVWNDYHIFIADTK